MDFSLDLDQARDVEGFNLSEDSDSEFTLTLDDGEPDPAERERLENERQRRATFGLAFHVAEIGDIDLFD